MNPLGKRSSEPSESEIQTKIIHRFMIDDWFCVRTHGNAHQAGFPDVYMCHRRFGARWVEVKKPKGYRFTQAQMDVFHNFAKKHIGVWVLTSHEDHERKKVFGPTNWYQYLTTCTLTGQQPKPIKKFGPEGIIQDQIISKLRSDDWYCIETYGNMFQSGLPDVYCCHAKYGSRWIECKNPNGYKFTDAQLKVFPRFGAESIGIWIMMSISDIPKMFGPPNWYHYLWK